MRNLIVVFGDQLDAHSAAFDAFDPKQDAILQIESREEATYIPQHRRRLALFFAAMRHFRDEQRAKGRTVHYSALDDPLNMGNFAGEIGRRVKTLKPKQLVAIEPGDFRVRVILGELRKSLGIPVDIREDRHFLCSRGEFADFLRHHRNPILETFYRAMRRKHDVLMQPDGSPVGGAWNFDKDNRQSFGKGQSPRILEPKSFSPDKITDEVLALVAREFPDGVGSLDRFDLPVTRRQARAALSDFVRHRLDQFGRYQDAMRGGEPLLYHSRLSAPLNLHLLTPKEIIDAALDHASDLPLNSLEGFVRQILGWREFVRGLYWRHMPDYAEKNALDADLPMPKFYWTGETDMRCLAEAIGHTIVYAYAHHIERLMVLGLFALLLGVRPYDVHRWHMSMFVDAIDWVSLPNALGMSQHGDGGIVGTKPYVASGNYIDRMSDHCRHCRYDPKKALGEDACPFTTLYWDFLARHRTHFSRNARMRNQYLNLDRRDSSDIAAIRRQADELKARMTAQTFL